MLCYTFSAAPGWCNWQHIRLWTKEQNSQAADGAALVQNLNAPRLTLILTLLFGLLSLFLASPMKAQTDAPKPRIEQDAIVLPVDIRDGLAYVTVNVEGNPAWMLIDTGAQVPLLAKRKGLGNCTDRKKVDSPNGSSYAESCGVVLRVGDKDFFQQALVVSEFRTRNADGLLGSDFFVGFKTMTLAYRDKVLRLVP